MRVWSGVELWKAFTIVSAAALPAAYGFFEDKGSSSLWPSASGFVAP